MSSKVYNEYLKLKNKNSNAMYLFKIGKFYIFLQEDAEKISKITTLKLTNHAEDVIKCGFPKESLNKYLDIFSNLQLNIIIIEFNDRDDRLLKYLEKIKKIDIDNITPRESIEILYNIKELL